MISDLLQFYLLTNMRTKMFQIKFIIVKVFV